MVTSNVYAGPVQTVQGDVSIVAQIIANRATVKIVVRVATTGDIDLILDLFIPGATIDGVTLVEGDRVLVWQQSNAKRNGIYVVASTGAYRASDFDESDEIVGSLISVMSGGALYGGALFRNTNTSTVIVDSDDITFEPFTAAPTVSAMVPYELVDGETFTVPVRRQALFTETILVASGALLVVDGHLLEVA